MGRRILDGYRVWSVALVRDPNSTDLTWSSGRSTEALLRTIKLDIEADSAWFYDRPQPIQGTAPGWAEERRIAFGDEANYVWNIERIRHPEFRVHMQSRSARLDDVFTFRPPHGELYPLYRFYPEIQTGSGLSNRFGWRSRHITAEKPPNVVRIGVLGDSTTSAYPGMVEHWLNLWAVRRNLGVRFEIINAARVASGALDAAAILDFELSSVDPDYVIIYGFGNGMYLADALIPLPPGFVKGQPASAAAAETGVVARASKRVSTTLEPWARYSAAAVFLRSRVMGQRGGHLLSEPSKPATHVAFPPDIDERSPEPEKIASHSGGGLMELDAYLQGLDKIDGLAKNRGIRLFVSTFRIMAFDGMLLGKGDSNNGGLIYDVINGPSWWPYTYAEIHRLTTFYNRTLRTWADRKGYGVVPVNEQMPWRPELYGDVMHELPAGEALHAWIVLQQLMPRIRDDLAQHRLPRPARPPRRDIEQYWKIERVSLATAIDSPPPEPADEIAGAFPLSTIALANAGAEIVPGEVPLIRTAMEPSGYAASVPIAISVAAGLTGKGWVRVRIRVTEGRIIVGVLKRSTQGFLTYATLDRTPDIQGVHLMIDDLSEVGGVMISNSRSGGAARSVAELHSAVLMRFRR